MVRIQLFLKEINIFYCFLVISQIIDVDNQVQTLLVPACAKIAWDVLLTCTFMSPN